MNRRFLALLFAALIALSGVAVGATKTTAPMTGSLSLDAVSRYAFRGLVIADESLQSAATIEYGAFNAAIWSNRPISNSSDSEVDYTVGVGGFGGLDAGITAYTYSTDGAKTTWEPYLGYSTDILPRLTASIYGFRDVTLNVTTVELKSSFLLCENDRVKPTAEIVFGAAKPAGGESYSYWSGAVAIAVSVTDRIDVTASVLYTSSDDRAAKRGITVGRLGVQTSF